MSCPGLGIGWEGFGCLEGLKSDGGNYRLSEGAKEAGKLKGLGGSKKGLE